MPIDPSKVRALREATKITQAEAASRAGMPQPHWSRIESGERIDPALSTAEKVAKALRCPLRSILSMPKDKPG